MKLKVALVGHPNVGKSVIFNNLTGLSAIISNYPGTTVEIYRGKLKKGNLVLDIVDTPGTYSLIPTTQAEEVTRKVLLEEVPDVIVQVVDAVSLRRHLYLTLELLEVGIPLVLVVNQVDRAKALGINVSREELERLLGIPVVMCIATKGEGMKLLVSKIVEAYRRGPPVPFKYSKDIEEFLHLVEKAIMSKLPEKLRRFSKSITSMIVLGDTDFENIICHLPEDLRSKLFVYGKKLAMERIEIADEVFKNVVQFEGVRPVHLSKIDRISVSPAFGLAIMSGLTLAIVYGILGLIHEVGHRIPSIIYYDFYEPLVRNAIESLIPSGLLRDILIGEKAGIYGSLGLLTTGVFFVFFMILPTIFFLYLVLGFLEDIGLLPRIAVSFNRPLQRMGLPGDAIMPLVVGTGCSIVGVLSTRILKSDKERFIASLLQILGIPCMAQQVMIWYVLGKYGSLYIFILYLLLVLTITIIGFLLNKIIPDKRAVLLLEFPPWRKPQFKNILKKSYTRVLGFLKSGAPLALMGILLINLAYYTGLVTIIVYILSPLMSSLFKLPSEISLALVISALRKDVAVGVLGRYNLTPLQALTAIIVITLSFPCVGSLAITLSEFKLRQVLLMVCLMFVISLIIGSILGTLSTLLAISE